MTPVAVAAQVLTLLGIERLDPEEPLAWVRVADWVQALRGAEQRAARTALVAMIDLDYRNAAAEAEVPWMHVGLPSGMRLDDLLCLETAALVAGRLGWGEALPRLQAVARDMRWHAVYPNVRQLQKELDRVLAELGVTRWGRYQAAVLGAALGAHVAGGADVWQAPLLQTLVAVLGQGGSDVGRSWDGAESATLAELVPAILAQPVTAWDGHRRGRVYQVACDRVSTAPIAGSLLQSANIWQAELPLMAGFDALSGDPVAAALAGALHGLSLGLPGLPRRHLIDLPARGAWVEMADRLANQASPGVADEGTLC